MEAPFKIPFYAKVALIFICVFSFVVAMHIGQDIIIPIVFATIIAIVLNPLVNYLIRKKVNRTVAISIAVTLAVVVVLGTLYLISTQLIMFSETYPVLKEKFKGSSAELVQWLSKKLNINESKINVWIQETQNEAVTNFAIGEKITQVGQLIIVVTLLPVYLLMILYYKPLLLEFIHKLFRPEYQVAVGEVLASVKKIVQSYLVGLLFELVIVAVLNSVGLLLLGVEYAIILGIIGAFLNLIPYIGGIIAIALPMIIAFVTTDSITSPILVFFVYIFVQFIDNNYLVPKIVASRVQINALMSLVVVLIGGVVWGVSGMFLSIPLTAIVKVIFDHIEPLKPWGFLLGTIVPTSSRYSFIKRKPKSPL